MDEQLHKLEGQWSRLLAGCYGEVKADPEFKAELLGALRLKQKALPPGDDGNAGESAEEKNWSRLLSGAYGASEPDSRFRDRLLAQLKRNQAEMAAASRGDKTDNVFNFILNNAYAPVFARGEFRTRLLGNLRERQRGAVTIRRASRRRTIFLSSFSGLSAAALVMFVAWLHPMSQTDAPPIANPGGEMTLAMMKDMPVHSSGDLGVVPSPSGSPAMDAIPAGPDLATAGRYRVADVFSGRALPEAARGIGMECDAGNGWMPMDAERVAAIEPGMAFRPRAAAAGAAGLGFGDGSTMLLHPGAEVAATVDGFSVRRGTLAVTVPDNSGECFRLHFPERDLAIERGTMLAVAVESPEKYAAGGVPAPVIRVADGGMAVARGKNGSGILLANQSYRIDNYVTAGIPGRPLGASEYEDLEKSFRIVQPVLSRSEEVVPPNLLASGNWSSPRSRPSQPDGFVKKDNRWVASSYENQPPVRIKYLSDDYFGFANQRRDLAPALALGSEVILDGKDGLFYEIYK